MPRLFPCREPYFLFQSFSSFISHLSMYFFFYLHHLHGVEGKSLEREICRGTVTGLPSHNLTTGYAIDIFSRFQIFDLVVSEEIRRAITS